MKHRDALLAHCRTAAGSPDGTFKLTRGDVPAVPAGSLYSAIKAALLTGAIRVAPSQLTDVSARYALAADPASPPLADRLAAYLSATPTDDGTFTVNPDDLAGRFGVKPSAITTAVADLVAAGRVVVVDRAGGFNRVRYAMAGVGVVKPKLAGAELNAAVLAWCGRAPTDADGSFELSAAAVAVADWAKLPMPAGVLKREVARV